MSDTRICLGKIVGAQGLKGEVKIKTFTEFPENIVNYGVLEDQAGSKQIDIKITGVSKGIVRAKVKGSDDRNSAESLIGTELWVSKNLLPELEEEEFYHTDLIGLDVKLADTLELVGEVIMVYNFGAGDILDIKLLESSKTVMIPFDLKSVPEVSISKKHIIVSEVFFSLIDDKKDDEEKNED